MDGWINNGAPNVNLDRCRSSADAKEAAANPATLALPPGGASTDQYWLLFHLFLVRLRETRRERQHCDALAKGFGLERWRMKEAMKEWMVDGTEIRFVPPNE